MGKEARKSIRDCSRAIMATRCRGRDLVHARAFADLESIVKAALRAERASNGFLQKTAAIILDPKVLDILEVAFALRARVEE